MEKNVKKTQRYYPFTYLHHKCKSDNIWLMRYKAQQSFFVILGHFLPFYPTMDPPKLKFGKNPWRYYFIQVYHKSQSYDAWFLRHEVWQNFLSFCTTFCFFTRLKTQKIKILEKWKKCLERSSFHTSVPKTMIICYTFPEIWCM